MEELTEEEGSVSSVRGEMGMLVATKVQESEQKLGRGTQKLVRRAMRSANMKQTRMGQGWGKKKFAAALPGFFPWGHCCCCACCCCPDSDALSLLSLETDPGLYPRGNMENEKKIRRKTRRIVEETRPGERGKRREKGEKTITRGNEKNEKKKTWSRKERRKEQKEQKGKTKRKTLKTKAKAKPQKKAKTSEKQGKKKKTKSPRKMRPFSPKQKGSKTETLSLLEREKETERGDCEKVKGNRVQELPPAGKVRDQTRGERERRAPPGQWRTLWLRQKKPGTPRGRKIWGEKTRGKRGRKENARRAVSQQETKAKNWKQTTVERLTSPQWETRGPCP